MYGFSTRDYHLHWMQADAIADADAVAKDPDAEEEVQDEDVDEDEEVRVHCMSFPAERLLITGSRLRAKL